MNAAVCIAFEQHKVTYVYPHNTLYKYCTFTAKSPDVSIITVGSASVNNHDA